MKKYSKKLLDFFNELHIVDVKKINDPSTPEFFVDFNVKSQDLTIFMDKDLKENKIIKNLLEIKDSVVAYYNECINLSKLPLQTSFKVNEIEGIPVKYVIDDDSHKWDYMYDEETGTFVIKYKSIFSTKVDEFVEKGLNMLTETAKQLNDIEKFILEHNNKYISENPLLPHEVHGIPVVYNCADDVEEIKAQFDQDKFLVRFSVNPKNLKEFVATINDFYEFQLAHGLEHLARNVVLRYIKKIDRNSMFFNYDDFENQHKVKIWGEDYKIEEKFSDEYPVITEDTRFKDVLEIDDDKKVITYLLNPKDEEKDDLYLFFIDFMHDKMEQVIPQYLKLCNDNGLDLKELTPNECDGPLYKLNNIRKKLDLNLLLAGFPKSLSKFVTLWGALRLNKEYKTVNDFFEKLTEIHPDWIKDAAFLLGMDEEIVINALGVREILKRY